jgi:hypothetical protein
LAMPTWSVGSRDLCLPRTEADGKPVTESNLSLRALAQRAAVRCGQAGASALLVIGADVGDLRAGLVSLVLGWLV